jgi:hypothetical protein
MSRTRADIQFKALAILTNGDVGAAPSAEDADALNGYIDDEVDELNADGTVYIADPDDLPNELFLTFSKLVANAAADEFGGKSDDARALQLRNRLRVIARATPGYGPQQVVYF